MAKECGWDKDFIAEKFTIDQIKKYYDVLYKEKLKDLKLYTIATTHATGRAYGSVKEADFKSFLNSLDLKERDTNKDLDMFKGKFPGLIEEN